MNCVDIVVKSANFSAGGSSELLLLQLTGY